MDLTKSGKQTGPSRSERTLLPAPGFATKSMVGDFAANHLSYNCQKYMFGEGYKQNLKKLQVLREIDSNSSPNFCRHYSLPTCIHVNKGAWTQLKNYMGQGRQGCTRVHKVYLYYCLTNCEPLFFVLIFIRYSKMPKGAHIRGSKLGQICKLPYILII